MPGPELGGDCSVFMRSLATLNAAKVGEQRWGLFAWEAQFSFLGASADKRSDGV
jgi:hypothetical protein